MYVTCPDCGSDDIKYVIPPDSDEVYCAACGEHFSLSELGYDMDDDDMDDDDMDDDDMDDDDMDDDIEKVDRPFQLEHGRLYDCSIEFLGTIEKASMIPFAKDPKSSRRFVMVDARRLLAENPSYIKEIAELSFQDIMHDGIRSKYPFDYEALTVLCKPSANGKLIDYQGDTILFDFVKTDLIF